MFGIFYDNRKSRLPNQTKQVLRSHNLTKNTDYNIRPHFMSSRTLPITPFELQLDKLLNRINRALNGTRRFFRHAHSETQLPCLLVRLITCPSKGRPGLYHLGEFTNITFLMLVVMLTRLLPLRVTPIWSKTNRPNRSQHIRVESKHFIKAHFRRSVAYLCQAPPFQHSAQLSDCARGS